HIRLRRCHGCSLSCWPTAGYGPAAIDASKRLKRVEPSPAWPDRRPPPRAYPRSGSCWLRRAENPKCALGNSSGPCAASQRTRCDPLIGHAQDGDRQQRSSVAPLPRSRKVTSDNLLPTNTVSPGEQIFKYSNEVSSFRTLRSEPANLLRVLDVASS